MSCFISSIVDMWIMLVWKVFIETLLIHSFLLWIIRLTSLTSQSSDSTVFFFTVGEKYNPIGFVRVPGPVQALEWSPHSHVSLVPDPLALNYLDIYAMEHYQFNWFVLLILHRVKTGCSSYVRAATWSRYTVLIQRPRSQTKPSSCLNCPADLSGSGASNLESRSVLALVCRVFIVHTGL